MKFVGFWFIGCPVVKAWRNNEISKLMNTIFRNFLCQPAKNKYQIMNQADKGAYWRGQLFVMFTKISRIELGVVMRPGPPYATTDWISCNGRKKEKRKTA